MSASLSSLYVSVSFIVSLSVQSKAVISNTTLHFSVKGSVTARIRGIKKTGLKLSRQNLLDL